MLNNFVEQSLVEQVSFCCLYSPTYGRFVDVSFVGLFLIIIINFVIICSLRRGYGTVTFSLYYKTHCRFVTSLVASVSVVMTRPVEIEKV